MTPMRQRLASDQAVFADLVCRLRQSRVRRKSQETGGRRRATTARPDRGSRRWLFTAWVGEPSFDHVPQSPTLETTMMLNPGQLNANHGIHGTWGHWGQPAGLGVGPVLSAYGNNGQGFGQGFGQQSYGLQNFAGFNAPTQGTSAIDDIADDIAERVASEIADQAATGAAALFQAQVPQAGGQSLGGLNVKRWLNAARITDTVHDPIKQSAHQLCRQVVGHLLNVLQAQWSGVGQHGGHHGAQAFGAPGQF